MIFLCPEELHKLELTKKDNFRYHVPRSWLKPKGNLMVVFEELGGNPNWISLMKREISSVCADINEWQPTLVNWHLQSSRKVSKPLRPKAHLWCAPGQTISSIKFASFGTPEGSCGNYREGSCHAHKSYDIFEKVCSSYIAFRTLNPLLNFSCGCCTISMEQAEILITNSNEFLAY